jgi:prefoldin subunit 5
MSEPEQNKTDHWQEAIKQAVRKFGCSPYIVSDEYKRFCRLVGEEYSSQQTASLQKQVEELRKEKERLQEWKREMMQLNKSIFDWGHSKETGLQIGSSIFAEAAKRLYAYKHLEAENAAANKRIEELTAKNLKLLNENNDLWDKVHNPKMKV